MHTQASAAAYRIMERNSVAHAGVKYSAKRSQAFSKSSETTVGSLSLLVDASGEEAGGGALPGITNPAALDEAAADCLRCRAHAFAILVIFAFNHAKAFASFRRYNLISGPMESD